MACHGRVGRAIAGLEPRRKHASGAVNAENAARP
jgi:hypothetical protein